MSDFNLLAIIVSGITSFVLSGAYYAVLSGTLAKLSKAYAENTSMSVVEILLEVLRSLVVACGVAVLVAMTNVSTLIDGVYLAIILWASFPVILLAGSVLHEKVPAKLAAIHAGDWLLKLTVVTTILAIWK